MLLLCLLIFTSANVLAFDFGDMIHGAQSAVQGSINAARTVISDGIKATKSGVQFAHSLVENGIKAAESMFHVDEERKTAVKNGLKTAQVIQEREEETADDETQYKSVVEEEIDTVTSVLKNGMKTANKVVKDGISTTGYELTRGDPIISFLDTKIKDAETVVKSGAQVVQTFMEGGLKAAGSYLAGGTKTKSVEADGKKNAEPTRVEGIPVQIIVDPVSSGKAPIKYTGVRTSQPGEELRDDVVTTSVQPMSDTNGRLQDVLLVVNEPDLNRGNTKTLLGQKLNVNDKVNNAYVSNKGDTPDISTDNSKVEVKILQVPVTETNIPAVDIMKSDKKEVEQNPSNEFNLQRSQPSVILTKLSEMMDQIKRVNNDSSIKKKKPFSKSKTTTKKSKSKQSKNGTGKTTTKKIDKKKSERE